MLTKIKREDAAGLMLLLYASGIDTMRNQFSLDAEGNFFIPEAVADKVKQILDKPDWPQRGKKLVLIAHAEEARMRLEDAGIVVDDFKIATDKDRRSQLLLMSLGTEQEIRFKTADHQWMVMSPEFLRVVQKSIINWIQRCYAVQQRIETMIEHGQITKPEQIDAEFDKGLG
jgi:hypothetical protein